MRPIDAVYTMRDLARRAGGRKMHGRQLVETRLPTYGRRARFGPYHRQAVRFLGRAVERLGQRLDSWSWDWR